VDSDAVSNLPWAAADTDTGGSMYVSIVRPLAFDPSSDRTYTTGRTLRRTRILREERAGYDADGGYGRYEAEGSERRALGSFQVASDAWWAVTLTVPIPDRNVAFVSVERHGPPPVGYRGSEETADLSVPVGEIDALVALLVGAVAHARRDGVLPQ
jgi:hypothetical protein